MRTHKGQWIGSGGFGLTFSPTLIMITPQLEYVYKPNLSIGPLAQLAFGDNGILFTASGAVRWTFRRQGSVHPVVEGGLGLATASSLFNSSFGVHVLAGFGADYVLDDTTSIGTMLRLNFAPPLKSMFVSWPVIIGRFLL